jgi:hypothetical protein
MASPPPPSEPSTLAHRLSWGFGCLFLLGGLTATDGLVAVIWILMGLVLVPPVVRYLHSRTKLRLTRKRKATVLAAGVLLTMLLGVLDTPSQAESDRQWWERFYAEYYGG